MRLNRLEASLARVFGPAAPPSEGFLGTAYAALTFNGGHLIPAQVRIFCSTEPCLQDPQTLRPLGTHTSARPVATLSHAWCQSWCSFLVHPCRQAEECMMMPLRHLKP